MINLLNPLDKLSRDNFPNKSQPIFRSTNKFLQDIIENLDDGVIILNQQKVLYINLKANKILSKIQQNTSTIWHICQSLIKNQNTLFQNYAVLSDEVTASKNQIIRIRARKLELS
ncbi:MAG: PAS domain-containing protein, partial [Cyanobacteria bacterium P01_A01_bin.84]